MNTIDIDREAKIKTLENELTDMEQERSRLYAQMGKSVMEIAEREIASSDDLVDAIIAKRRELARLKDEHPCPFCSLNNSKDSRYCRHCGKKLVGSDTHNEGGAS